MGISALRKYAFVLGSSLLLVSCLDEEDSPFYAPIACPGESSTYVNKEHCLSEFTYDYGNGWGVQDNFMNRCNETITFHYCYTSGGSDPKYLCENNNNLPTQFVGIGSGNSKVMYQTPGEYGIRYWAFRCEKVEL